MTSEEQARTQARFPRLGPGIELIINDESELQLEAKGSALAVAANPA